jgi:ribosomal protein S14
MPIRKELRWLYPIDWPQVSAWVRFERAKGRCEQCGRPHGQMVHHLGDGRWFDADAEVWRNGRGREIAWPAYAEYRKLASTKVVLAAAHLDHDPTNSHPRNLRALCQRCHMLHDQVEHQRRRRLAWRAKRALGDLFLGPYRPW